MLHEHGCEIHVAARNNLAEKNGLTLNFVEQVFNVPFQRSPFSPKNLKAYRQLKKIIDEGHYDVVHCNTPVGGVLGRLAARRTRRCGTKVFYTAHGFHFYKGAPKKNWFFWYPIEKFMCRYTDKLITISEEDYALAAKSFPMQIEHIHGVGADARKYRKRPEEDCKALRNELFSSSAHFLLCTGELLPNKNQSAAIQAMQQVASLYPETVLLMAGNGQMRQKLEQEVRQFHLEKNVRFLGYRTDLERFVNIAEIIISCSFREGLPMNIVEAMLLAKPVIASDNRGHRELIIPGENGYLVPPADSALLAEKIMYLLSHPKLAVQMGQTGLKKAQPYTDAHVKQELKQIYFGKPQETTNV